MTEAVTTTPASTTGDTATAQNDGGVAKDTSVTTGDVQGSSNEELYEVTVGKGQDGQPIVKKFTKADLLKHAGMGVNAHEKFAKAKENLDKLNKFLQAGRDKGNLKALLKGLGHDPDAILDEWVQQAITEAQEDPKDKELRLTKAKLEKYLQQEAAQAKAREEAETRDKTEVFTKQLNDKISKALGTVRLPDNKANRAAVAKILSELWTAKDANGKQLFPDPLQIPDEQVVQYLKTNRVGSLKSLIEGADYDSLVETLGPDVLEMITKAVSTNLQKKTGRVDNTIKVNETSSTPARKPVKTTSQLRAEIEERLASESRSNRR
jgi:hypothetical protein